MILFIILLCVKLNKINNKHPVENAVVLQGTVLRKSAKLGLWISNEH